MYSSVVYFQRAFVLVAISGLASSIPLQLQQHSEDGGGAATAGGLGTVLWSVLEDCLAGDESAEPAAVCLKSKALTALDRALSKPTVTVADGLVLSARAGKSLMFDSQAEKADRAALDAAKDSDHKNAMLDDMLASRIDRLMSSRSIVLEEPAGEEGRGKKKDKGMKQAMMMAGMMAAAVMGPMAMKMIGLIAMKALIVAKIALVLSGIIALKKLLQSQQSSGDSGHESETVSHHYARSMSLEAHDMAYSGQKQ